jgi:hypothetical protein
MLLSLQTNFMKSVFLLLLLFSFAAVGQSVAEPAYFVYSLKGPAARQTSNAKLVQLKQNQLLYPSETLIVKQGAEVALANKNADYLLLKTPGTYKVAALAGFLALRITVDNITKEYLRLLYNELLGTGFNYTRLKKESTRKAWGGVPRGSGAIQLLFPQNGLKTAGDSLRFVWKGLWGTPVYYLQLLDGQDNRISTIPVRDTQYMLPLQQLQQGQAGRYYWYVARDTALHGENELYHFDVLPKEEEAQLAAAIVAPFDHTNLLQGLKSIEQLEANGLIDAAFRQYQQLLASHPGNKVLRKSYALFLMQRGYDEQAKRIMENSVAKKF